MQISDDHIPAAVLAEIPTAQTLAKLGFPLLLETFRRKHTFKDLLRLSLHDPTIPPERMMTLFPAVEVSIGREDLALAPHPAMIWQSLIMQALIRLTSNWHLTDAVTLVQDMEAEIARQVEQIHRQADMIESLQARLDRSEATVAAFSVVLSDPEAVREAAEMINRMRDEDH